MSLTRQEIQSAFEAVQEVRNAGDGNEKPDRNMSNEGMTFAGPVGRMAEIDNSRPAFNQAANDKLSLMDQGNQSSKQVENEKLTPELKPSPENDERKEVDRDAHNQAMVKDDMAAQKAEILRMAQQIQEQEGPELGMDR